MRLTLCALLLPALLGCERICGDEHPEWGLQPIVSGPQRRDAGIVGIADPTPPTIEGGIPVVPIEDDGGSDDGGAEPPAQPMSFFVTSRNPGGGGNLGGFEGADKFCELLAGEVGAGEGDWHAYLSGYNVNTAEIEDARDRIGTGPWFNAVGVMIAADLSELHALNKLDADTALTETGKPVPNDAHDILTGSTRAGTVYAPVPGRIGDANCEGWTSDMPGPAPRVGHHDRQTDPSSETAEASWNSDHIVDTTATDPPCSLAGLRGPDLVGQVHGAGLFYCFAR